MKENPECGEPAQPLLSPPRYTRTLRGALLKLQTKFMLNQLLLHMTKANILLNHSRVHRQMENRRRRKNRRENVVLLLLLGWLVLEVLVSECP
jgi:hypothetical protein